MAWALYEETKHTTHSGKYRVERILRIERTLEEAVERNCKSRAVIREVIGSAATPMCACGDPFWLQGDGWMRCYSCRASERVT